MIGITSTAKGKGLNKSPKTALSPTFQPPHLPSPIGIPRSSHLSPETNIKIQNQFIYSNLKEYRRKPQNSPVWLVQGAAIYINIAAPCTTEIHTENQHLTLLVKPRVQPRFLHHLLILCFSCNPVIPKNKKSPKHFPFSVKIPIFASVPRAERSNAAKPAQLPNRYRLPNFLLFKSYLPTDYKKTIVLDKKTDRVMSSCGKNENPQEMNRRKFLKVFGGGAVASSAALYGCAPKNEPGAAVALGEVPTDKMTYRQHPTNGDKVSILGYGCMRWPLKQGSDGKDQIDQEAVNRLVDYAIEHGVNYFDTSPVYVQGMSEKATGIALARHPRNSYYLATKLSNFQNYTRENSLAMYRQSFRDLQTDYLDYYLLHSIGGGNGIELFNDRYINNGMLDFLVKEREAGRIRNLGWSFHGDVKVFDYVLDMGVKWDFVQIQLNYLDWKHASGRNVNADYLYGELEKRGIPAVIMEPLLGGRLSNVPDHIVARLKQQRPENSVASWAFRFAGSPDGVLTVLSGMTYMEHLQDNIRTYSPLIPVTDEEKDFLEETAQLMMKYPTIPCNDCKYCMPCPYALDIPGILLHYNKCVNEGNVPKSVQDENYAKARRAFLVGYDRSVPKLRQANHCTGCEQCNPHCPQGIDIPKEMQRIDKFVEELKVNG